MNKIVNWTVGSFFRTIGRIVAYAIIGFLIFLFASGKIKALKINGSNYVYHLPSDCTTYLFYINTWNSNYLVCSTGGKYGYISGTDSNYESINIYSNRNIISQSKYQDWEYYRLHGGTNPLTFGGVGFHDTINNKYYEYYGSTTLKYYSISYHSDNSTTITIFNNSPYFSRWIASNIDFVEYRTGDMINAPYNLQGFNVTFHLNGGTSFINENTGIGSIPIPYCVTDCTKVFYDENELNRVLDDLKIEKSGLLFEGWYYDYQFDNIYLPQNSLSGDLDLYANFSILNVENIVEDINFNEYTFDTNYRYAIISATTDFSKGIYLGFYYDFPTISVFNYRVGDSQFDLDAYQRLSSIGIYSGIYYYHLGNIVLDNVKLVILSKDQLKGVDNNGVLQEYYTFYVSDNANVTFTNDLTSISFDNTNGDNINANVSDSYFYNQNFIINTESDIITIFRSLGFGTNNTIFSTFSTLWTKFKGTPLYNYFFLICLGSLIIFIIKVCSRK